jgi:predicted CoA-binding protein
LVVRERSSGMTMVTVAPRKSSGEWLGKRVMAFMREAGCEVEAVVMNNDNEPALVKVVE